MKKNVFFVFFSLLLNLYLFFSQFFNQRKAYFLMGFPFTIKRAPGTVYYWEKNDWYRKSGYRIPIDSYLILQWICLIILDIGFFCFLVHFTTIYENTNIKAITETTFEALHQGWNQINSSYIDPLSTWNCTISF